MQLATLLAKPDEIRRRAKEVLQHAAGRPGVERAGHLPRITVPMLFVQGTRDALADRTLLTGVLFGLHVNAYLVDAVIGLSIVSTSFDNLNGFPTVFGFQPNTTAADQAETKTRGASRTRPS